LKLKDSITDVEWLYHEKEKELLFIGVMTDKGEFIIINKKKMTITKTISLTQEPIHRLFQIELKELFRPICYLTKSGSNIQCITLELSLVYGSKLELSVAIGFFSGCRTMLVTQMYKNEKCFNMLLGISNDQGFFFYNLDNLAMWIEYPPQVQFIIPLRSLLAPNWNYPQQVLFLKSSELPNRLLENGIKGLEAREDQLEIVNFSYNLVLNRNIQ